MQTQTFETSKGALLAIRLPDGAHGISLSLGGNKLFFWLHDDSEGTHIFYLPPGDWKEIGIWGSVTEEKAKEVVDDVYLAIMGRWFMNYADHTYTCERATQALQSLLETEIVLESKKKYPSDIDWHLDEAEVWKHFYLIFKTK